MTEFRTGRPGEMPEILDFGNYVFSHDHRPHDFRLLIPKVYGEGHNSESFHFLALEEDKIRGMIASYPHDYQVGGETLHIRFIGTVSVHPYARGGGYMRHLMADVDASNKEGGADLAILGGQRQRYRYFGYENGGVSLTFAVNKSNLRHGAGSYEERIALMPVEKEDTELLDLLYAFYQQGKVTGRKREEFFEILSTWKSRVFAAYYDMDCIGYLVVSEDGSRIVEIKLTDMTLLPKVLQEYMMMYYDGWNVQISVKAFETEMIQVLSDLAEECSVGNNLQYKIYNWPKVLRAFLNLKNSHEPLEDGCLTIDIKDTTRVQITVKDGIIAVEETDQPAEISLEPTQAVHLLTSPAFYYTPIPALKKNHWFPLTFAMSNLDEF